MERSQDSAVGMGPISLPKIDVGVFFEAHQKDPQSTAKNTPFLTDRHLYIPPE